LEKLKLRKKNPKNEDYRKKITGYFYSYDLGFEVIKNPHRKMWIDVSSILAF